MNSNEGETEGRVKKKIQNSPNRKPRGNYVKIARPLSCSGTSKGSEKKEAYLGAPAGVR